MEHKSDDRCSKRWERGVAELEIGGRYKTIQITLLLKLVRLLSRVLDTWEDFLSLKLQSNTSSKRYSKKKKKTRSRHTNNRMKENKTILEQSTGKERIQQKSRMDKKHGKELEELEDKPKAKIHFHQFEATLKKVPKGKNHSDLK